MLTDTQGSGQRHGRPCYPRLEEHRGCLVCPFPIEKSVAGRAVGRGSCWTLFCTVSTSFIVNWRLRGCQKPYRLDTDTNVFMPSMESDSITCVPCQREGANRGFASVPFHSPHPHSIDSPARRLATHQLNVVAGRTWASEPKPSNPHVVATTRPRARQHGKA